IHVDIKAPVILPPMAFASGADLTAAVSKAGGFGFLPAGFDSSETIKANLNSIRKTLNVPADAPVPAGVGFLGWITDMTEASEDPRLPAVLAEKIQAVWFAFGNDLGKHIKTVQDYDAKRTHKTKIFVIVNSLDEAKRAANEWKVDALVVQGFEAGGHGSSLSPPLFNFVPAVRRALPNIPIVAAGGVAYGSQVASLLVLGADAVALGTRFLFTNESIYTEQVKNVLVKSSFNHTSRSNAYDQAFQTDFWPSHIDGRAISTNDVISDFRAGLPLEERVKRFQEATKAGKDSHLIIWAGYGVAHTDKIAPAAVSSLFASYN
ncbi:2-nitropropane dioxygenase, partial [Irpex lacteus]